MQRMLVSPRKRSAKLSHQTEIDSAVEAYAAEKAQAAFIELLKSQATTMDRINLIAEDAARRWKDVPMPPKAEKKPMTEAEMQAICDHIWERL